MSSGIQPLRPVPSAGERLSMSRQGMPPPIASCGPRNHALSPNGCYKDCMFGLLERSFRGHHLTPYALRRGFYVELHDMCQIRAHYQCRSLGLGSTGRIHVSQADVDAGMISSTDAEQEPIARFGRSSHAIGQTFCGARRLRRVYLRPDPVPRPRQRDLEMRV